MDTARQVVRWSIPGWVFLLVLAILQAVTWLIQGYSTGSVLRRVSLLTPAAVAFVVTAGVPLGFILYQVYYSWYGRVLPFWFVGRDRGAEVLLALSPDTRDIMCSIEGKTPDLEELADCVGPFLLPYPFRRLRRALRSPAGRRRFEEKIHNNWDLVRFWVHRICIINRADSLRSEVSTLADIYHGVGAARTALVLACFLHLVLNVRSATVSPHMSQSVTAILAPYAVSLWLFRVFERTRTSALNSLLATLILAFRTFSATVTNSA